VEESKMFYTMDRASQSIERVCNLMSMLKVDPRKDENALTTFGLTPVRCIVTDSAEP